MAEFSEQTQGGRESGAGLDEISELQERLARIDSLIQHAAELAVQQAGRAGEIQAALEAAIEEAGLTQQDVILAGYVPDDVLPALYAACRLFVFPSFHEGFGLPVLEAMAAGCPVITSLVSSLPEVTGDSIFAIIAEETGLIGSTVVIMAFVALIFLGLKVSQNAPDVFGTNLALGITSWIGLQALINIAAMVALVPLTGIPLPLISYGGSSIVIALLGLGILVNISKQA